MNMIQSNSDNYGSNLKFASYNLQTSTEFVVGIVTVEFNL